MSNPTDYEIRRDALMAAAACRPGEPVSEVLAIANQLSVWLWECVPERDTPLTQQAKPSEIRKPCLSIPVPPVSTSAAFDYTFDSVTSEEVEDIWETKRYCEECGHLWAVHSLGQCGAILGKDLCPCERRRIS